MTVVLDAYNGIAERYRVWLKGLHWLEQEKNWEHPLWAERSEEAVKRGREFGQLGDELADWLDCPVGDLLALMDWDLKERGRQRNGSAVD